MMGLLLCACAGPSVRTIEVASLESDGSGPVLGSAASQADLAERAGDDGFFLGLSISGGGSRAAIFGAAVMQELQRLTLLDRVDVISAVSGGALSASLYALDGGRGLLWDAQITERLAYDFQGAVVSHILNPLHWPRYWFTSYTRGDALVEVLDSRLFHGATLGEVSTRSPRLLLNATDALTGEPFVLSQERLGRLGLAQESLPVSQAIGASAAYPDTLPPVALRPRRGGAAVDSANAPTVTLYDGGVADNLGLSTLLSFLEEADDTRPLAARFPNGCLVIAVDATPRKDREGPTPLSAAAGLLRNNRREVLERAGIPAAQQDRQMVASARIGSGDARCTVWHVALRHLPREEPLGQLVTQIPTTLRMTDSDRLALERAARWVVDRSWLLVQGALTNATSLAPSASR